MWLEHGAKITVGRTRLPLYCALEPCGQTVQLVAPSPLYVSVGQSVHGVAGFRSSSAVPGGQMLQLGRTGSV